MSARRRYPPPMDLEVAVARRMRQVRTEYHLSRRAIAEHLGLTPDQLNRIERGAVALRFGPGWKFCELTQTNPLWLTFGDWYSRLGFFHLQQVDSLEQAAPFVQTMLGRPIPSPDHISGHSNEIALGRQVSQRARIKIKMLVETGIKHYLANMAPLSWKKLRSRLKAATSTPGARAALARSFGVSTSAVSQWLSGASAPTADTTLRLLEWVTAKEAEQKRGPEALRRGRPKRDPKSKSTTYEKAKSGRTKQ